MVRNRLLVVLLLVAALFIFGCTGSTLGLKTLNDCISVEELNPATGLEEPRPMLPAEKILCYHEAAISKAYVINPNNPADVQDAVDICESIAVIGDLYDDQRTFAKTQKNLCLSDVAVILKDGNICEDIEQEAAAGLEHGIFGAPVTKDICNKKVENAIAVNPANYVCPFLPLFVGAMGLFFIWKRVHDL